MIGLEEVLKVFNGRPKNGYLDAYTRVLLLRDRRNKQNERKRKIHFSSTRRES
jgi:hypothetical protein